MNAQTVLIVEDRERLALNYADWLRIREWKPQVALSGAAGVEAYQQTRFDVVLLDVRLPDFDGFEVFAKLKEFDPDVCVVFLTAYGDVPAAVRALKDGAMDFVEKPVANEILLEKLRLAAEAKRSAIDARAKQEAETEVKVQKARLEEQASSLTFATGMAHKIDGKLAALLSYLGVLELFGASEERRSRVIRNCRELCDICHASLRTFAMLAKKQEMPVASVGVEDVLRRAVQIASLVTGNHGETPRKLVPHLDITPGLTVLGNFDLLEAALECLIENAMDASGSDGEVTVTAHKDSDELATIEIADRGHGFPNTFLNTPLRPFGSTRKSLGHLGFGLFFASEVAKSCGGGLTYGNRPDGGAFVRFSVKQKP